MIEVLGLRFEKREHPNRLWQALMTVLAILVALAISSVLIISAGANLEKAFAGLFTGAFGSWKAILETLVKATPLILTGLAVTVAFRGKIMNIGAEGQFWAGAITGYWASANFSSLHPALHFVFIIFMGFVGGALWGLVPGLLKGLFKVDETIVTVMMNYIIMYVLSFLLSGVWQAPKEFYYISPRLPDAVSLPLVFPNTRLHIGFIIAIRGGVCGLLAASKNPARI